MELQEVLGEHLKGRISSSLRQDLCGRLLTYIYRGPVSVQQLRAFVTEHQIDFNLFAFRKELSSNGSVLFGSKTYLYSQVASKYQPEARTLSSKDCGVSIKEARLLTTTANGHKLLGDTLAYYAKKQYRALHPEELQRLVTEVICTDDYEKYVSKYVYRKMSFLIKSFGYTAEDLINDLKRSSMYAVLRTYPAFNDYAHVLRLAKSTAHNIGINIIHQATTAGRQRLTRDNTPLLVPLHVTESNGGASVADHDGSLINDSYLVVGRSGTRTSNDELDTYASLRMLLNSKKLREEQKRFLRLMMGTPDVEFSTWLGQPNEDLVEKSYDVYLNSACLFLSIQIDEARSFLRKLSKYL